MVTIYHNGECSKSQGALEILQEQNTPHKVRYYLIEPLSIDELKHLLSLLRLNVTDIVRKHEPLYREQFEGKEFSEDGWLTILVQNPILIERPIVTNGDKALIARPPERVLEVT